MFSDIFPQVLVAVLISLVFGILFDKLVEWVNEHKVWHVSISVAIGVGVTVLIPTVALAQETLTGWMFGAALLVCFTASGIPMIVGASIRHAREVQEKKAKKARPLGNTNAKVRDFVVMELAHLADEMAEKSAVDDMTELLRNVTVWVHRLHVAARSLKSM